MSEAYSKWHVIVFLLQLDSSGYVVNYSRYIDPPVIKRGNQKSPIYGCFFRLKTPFTEEI